MELKDLIKIDKTLRKPSVVEQVVSQMVDDIESGTLPDNLCILPDSCKFARELGITPTNGCKYTIGLQCTASMTRITI